MNPNDLKKLEAQLARRVVLLVPLGITIVALAILPFAALAQNPVGLAPTDWPMFQGDTAHSGRSALLGIAAHPVEIWKINLSVYGNHDDAPGMSIGLDGSIYVAASGIVFAVDPQTGDINWTFCCGARARSTPAIAANGVAYWGHTDSFVAISNTGQLEWGWTKLTGNLGFQSSPVIDVDGNVYVSHDGVWSFAQDGSFRWFYPSTFYSHSSPAIGPDGTIYVAVEQGFLALRSDGSLKWSLPVQAYDNSPAIASDGTIYLGILSDQDGLPARVIAVDPNGTIKWSFVLDETIYSMNIPPAIGPDGTIYFADGDTFHPSPGPFSFYAVNPNGTLKWKVPIPSTVIAPPIVDRMGRILICARYSFCYTFTPEGQLLWQVYFPPDTDGTPIWVETTPLITSDGNVVILDSHDFLHAYIAATDLIYLPLVMR